MKILCINGMPDDAKRSGARLPGDRGPSVEARLTGTLTELGRLHMTRPAATASPESVAAWKRRRTAVREHLAAEQRRAGVGAWREGSAT